MTKAEIARYKSLTMAPEYGAGRLECPLCHVVFATGDVSLLVQVDREATELMDAGKPYENILMHRRCVEQVP
jgi:hypothetical protein